jgi:hypothetical protein
MNGACCTVETQFRLLPSDQAELAAFFGNLVILDDSC